jgi:hypothetical protein
MSYKCSSTALKQRPTYQTPSIQADMRVRFIKRSLFSSNVSIISASYLIGGQRTVLQQMLEEKGKETEIAERKAKSVKPL